MKMWFRGLIALMVGLFLLSSMSVRSEAAESSSLKALPNVQKMLKLTPDQVKEVYRKTQAGEIGVSGAVGGGVWWGGYYVDILDTTFIRNNTGQTPLVEFLRLGTGRCTDDTVSTSITLSIQGTRGSNYQNAINSSFGFTASGTRTWTRTERYCGPNDPNMLRIFYKHGIYNDYRAVVVRMYFTWQGNFHHLETVEDRVVQVPHPSYPTQDIPWRG